MAWKLLGLQSSSTLSSSEYCSSWGGAAGSSWVGAADPEEKQSMASLKTTPLTCGVCGRLAERGEVFYGNHNCTLHLCRDCRGSPGMTQADSDPETPTNWHSR